MIKVNELAEVVTEIGVQLEKVRVEISDKVANLENSLANVTIPDDAVAAISALKNTLNALDAIVPDTAQNAEEEVS